jgi:hypothetical protein
MPKKATNNMKKEARCSWTDADNAIIVRVFKEQKESGNQSGAD